MIPSFFFPRYSYPAILSTSLPHSQFSFLSKEHNSAMFYYLSKKLRALDVDFFLDMAKANIGYVFEVVLSFDIREALPVNLELCNLPFLKGISEAELSQDQIRSARTMGRKITKERPKLVTTLIKNHEIVDFIENILYVLIFHNLQLIKIRSIVMFRSYPYFNEYIQKLQQCRRDSKSKILGKVIKSLGNRK